MVLTDHLEEASLSLGAGRLRTFWRVILPQIRNCLVWKFALRPQHIVRRGGGDNIHQQRLRKTLPVKIWDAILYEITPILPAISALIILATLLLLAPLLLIRRDPQLLVEGK